MGTSTRQAVALGSAEVRHKVTVSDGTNPAVERTPAITQANAVATGSVSATPMSVNEGSKVTVSVTGATDPRAPWR